MHWGEKPGAGTAHCAAVWHAEPMGEPPLEEVPPLVELPAAGDAVAASRDETAARPGHGEEAPVAGKVK